MSTGQSRQVVDSWQAAYKAIEAMAGELPIYWTVGDAISRPHVQVRCWTHGTTATLNVRSWPRGADDYMPYQELATIVVEVLPAM